MLSRHYFSNLRNSNPQVYQGISELLDYVEALAGHLGVEPRPAPQTPTAKAVPPPQPATRFSVAGVDGHFLISVRNNSANRQPIYHEVASCVTLNFDEPGGITVYGPDVRTYWDIADPAAAKYWRLRSKFISSGFNTAQYFSTTASAGAMAVASGVLRAVATAPRTQRSANYLTVNAEYVAAGAVLANGDTSDGTPTLDWAAGSISHDGGAATLSVPRTTLRGVAANTTYVVAWDTSAALARYSSDGGQALGDSWIYLATVTTPDTLGGNSSSAGGGPNATGIAANGGRYAYT